MESMKLVNKCKVELLLDREYQSVSKISTTVVELVLHLKILKTYFF